MDWFFPAPLRGAPPVELIRYRVLLGATFVPLLFGLLNLIHGLLSPQASIPTKAPEVVAAMSFVGTLLLLRKARALTLPAAFLCWSQVLGFTVSIMLYGDPFISAHAVVTLFPALAVYLLGWRMGLVLAAFAATVLGLLRPLYLIHHGFTVPPITPNFLWDMHLAALITVMGIWLLGALHSTARDSVQASLERTLETLHEDIRARQQAEARLGEMHRALMDVSRQAGMAEVATGVLHNVGNALNSIHTSARVATTRLRKLRVPSLAKTAELLSEHADELASFLTADPRGAQLPAYLQALAHQMGREQQALLKELDALNEGIHHLESIVSMQQRHARTVGAVERLAVPQLIDEALRLHALSFDRLGSRIERDFAEVPPLLIDRHRLLQILMNLLSNARHALEASPRPDKCLRVRIRPSADRARLRLEVEDNGMGIAPEHLPLLFSQGFTTKETGHGFGLHISALAAAEMKGRLTCSSPGRGQGATFTLELPLTGEDVHP
ncbi:MAG: hypothetical protein JXB05_24710 [Myxococcaceae bacterium]|nr:hypothetical protein [Myxococcaceae bacterium]